MLPGAGAQPIARLQWGPATPAPQAGETGHVSGALCTRGSTPPDQHFLHRRHEYASFLKKVSIGASSHRRAVHLRGHELAPAVLDEPGPQALHGGVELGGLGVAGRGEGQVLLGPDRQHMEVQVVDAVAGHNEPGPGHLEDAHLCGADALGDHGQVRHHVIGRVHVGVDLEPWDHEDVPVSVRLNGGEGDADLVRPHETAGDLAGDDLGENRAHGPIVPQPGPDPSRFISRRAVAHGHESARRRATGECTDAAH